MSSSALSLSANGLARRRSIPEIMDQPELAPPALERALRSITRLNQWSGAGPGICRQLSRCLKLERGDRISILDVGCGSADVSLKILRLLRRRGLQAKLAACDKSPVAVARARSLAKRWGLSGASFFAADAVYDDLGGPYDVVMCSLFLHHLDEVAGVRLLERMRQAARDAVLVDDLCRSSKGYWLARVASRLLTTSPVVRFDAPASVRSAWTPAEALGLAEQAGLTGVRVVRRWPERYTLIWQRSTNCRVAA